MSYVIIGDGSSDEIKDALPECNYPPAGHIWHRYSIQKKIYKMASVKSIKRSLTVRMRVITNNMLSNLERLPNRTATLTLTLVLFALNGNRCVLLVVVRYGSLPSNFRQVS